MLASLERHKTHLTWARSYEEGQQKLRSEIYDAVIVDYNLGAQKGTDLIREFSSSYPAPFILYTGQGNYTVDAEAVQAGSSLYIMKGDTNPLTFERFIRLAMERKQAEQSRIEAESRYLTVFRYAPFPVVLINAGDRTYVDVNQAWEQLFGFTKEEVLGRTSLDLGIIPEPARREDAYAVLAQKGILIADEQAYLTRDGDTLCVLVNARTVTILGKEYVLSAVENITARKKAEEALREEHERSNSLARFPEENPNPVLRVSSAGIVLYRNPTAAASIDWAAEIGAPVPHDLLEFITLSIRENTSITITRTFSSRSYSIVFTGIPEKDYSNLYLVDITDRLSAEESLRQFLDNTHDTFFMVDRDWRLRYANHRFLEILGLSVEDVLGKDFWETFPVYLGTQIEQYFRKAMQDRVDVHFEHGGMYTDAWYQVSVHPTPDGISVFTMNQTEGHRAGEALRESEQRYRQLSEELMLEREKLEQVIAQNQAIMDSMNDGLIIADVKGNLLYHNPVSLALHGYHSLMEIQHPMDEVAVVWEVSSFDGLPLPSDLWPMAKALAGERFSNYEVLVRRTDTGQSFAGSYNGTPVLDESGEMIFAIITIRDITAKVRTDNELKKYAAELERSNQALHDFASIASHDLQEPLRKVQSFSRMLETRFSAELGREGKDYIARITSASTRMRQMLDGLFTYSRVTTQVKAFVEISLRTILEDVLSDLEIQILETQGKIEYQDLPIIYADPLQLRQLFQNLIGNALKYHRPGRRPEIKISCRKTDNHMIQVAITDNGIGINPGDTGRIFQPFVRLHGRAEYDGTGMGLAICKKIVERHGGTIHVESTPNHGSTFYVTLPTTR